MYNEQNFKPFNRYVQVKPASEDKNSQPAVLVPDDYKIEPKHKICEVLNWSKACNIDFKEGDHIVVESSMLEELTLNGTKYYLVLENYILATLGEPHYEN